MPEVTLKAGGHLYTGWKQVSITRSMETLASTFSLGLSQNFTNQSRILPIAFDEQVEVLIDGERVITGIVDDIATRYSDESHDYTISGRSRAGDLVDCTAIYKTGEFLNQKLDTIARELCQPFGLKVIVHGDTGKPFTRFRTDDATVFSCLERGARHRGVLLMSDPDGNVIFTRPGKQKISTPLKQGGKDANIKSCSGQSAMNSRFSNVIVKGQAENAAFMTDQQISQPKAEATDKNVPRYRPLVIQAESQGNGQTLEERALFEVSTRMGRAKQLTYEVADWRHGNGLWEPNHQVRVIDPVNNIDRWMLISAVTFSHGEDGTTSAITVMPPEAFALVAIPEQEPSVF
ncbi:phage baseplate assembly protein [Endozoicomonas acroporae]|uniref:phage baseplate assembly protein n=1 Tax=Endozoicomonas acroporae TaxID=1701104 RepID=UPI0013D0C688|nr:hypothetical protein [Endozoicomonas acroporae]